VASYSLQRGHGIRRAALLDAFVRDSEDATYAERLKATIARLESKLRAIELIPSLDARALRAATTHTRLVCGHEGYELLEVDDPPAGRRCAGRARREAVHGLAGHSVAVPPRLEALRRSRQGLKPARPTADTSIQ